MWFYTFNPRLEKLLWEDEKGKSYFFSKNNFFEIVLAVWQPYRHFHSNIFQFFSTDHEISKIGNCKFPICNIQLFLFL